MTRLRHRPDAFQWRGDMYAYHRIADGDSLACLDRYSPHAQVWPLHSGRKIEPTGPEIREIIRQVHWLDLPERDHDDTRFEELMARIAALEAKLAAAPEATPAPAATLDAELDQSVEDHPELFDQPASDPRDEEIARLHAELALRSEPPKLPDMGESDDAVEFPPQVCLVPEDLGQLMAPGESIAAAVERMTPGIDELLTMATVLSESSFEEAFKAIPPERIDEWMGRLNDEKALLRPKRGTEEENLVRENLIDRVKNMFGRVGARR